MKNPNMLRNVSALAICILLIAGAGFAFAEEGKIPITTSSEKALNYYLEGRTLFENLRFTESRQFFEKAVAEDPNFALGYLYLAFSQPSNKEYFETFEKAKVLMEKVSEGERLWISGVEAANNGMPMKQREFYQELVAMYPDDERAHALLGNHYFGQQQYNQAIEEYNRAINKAANFPPVYNQLGYAYRFLEMYEEAEKAFEKYIKLIPGDPNPYDSHAELLMKVGKFEKSIVSYQNALDLNPTFVASHVGIATNYNFLGNYEKARNQLQVMLDVAVNDGQRRAAHFAMVVSYVDEGDLESALIELQKQYALAEKINDATAMAGDLATMGNILLFQGKADEALVKFKSAVEIVSKSNLSDEIKRNTKLGYLFNEARVALKKNDIETAKNNWEKYSTQIKENKNPFQIMASHELAGLIALQENNYKTAIEEFQQANQQNTYNLYRIALAYKESGDKENADKMFDKVVNFSQLNSLNYALIRKDAQKLLASK